MWYIQWYFLAKWFSCANHRTWHSDDTEVWEGYNIYQIIYPITCYVIYSMIFSGQMVFKTNLMARVSILEPLDSLLAPREGPYRFVVDLWCFLSMLDGSGASFRGLWARFWHLERVPGITLGHPGAQTPKNIKNIFLGNPFWITF